MENIKERTKRQHREEPDRETEAEAGSSNDLKRYKRLLSFEKQPGRIGDE
jgi:hypothetical protein